ncbi:MAG TPA: TonB-dependent receptor [Opitutaceae bacterium]|nr:TonB-dependent receptor [Opitutaceae bacterium]
MSPSRSRFPIALAAALGVLSGRAQTAPSAPSGKDDPVHLSVFEVSTSRDIGYQSTNAAEVTRMNTPIENIPMNVTVFNQQFIDDLMATDTSQLLAYEPSAVKTTENDGFMARGSGSVGTNFLDGFAQTSGFGSQPLANIERVEIIRGPAAVLYGAGGYGGTFNRITKKPQPTRRASLRVIASDGHSTRTELDYNHGALPWFNRRLSFRITGILDRGRTWFGQRRVENGIAPSLRWNIGPDTTLVAEYFYDFRDNQASWETPVHGGNPIGMVTGDGVFRVMPRRIAWISPQDYRRNTRQVASLDLRHAFTDNLQFRSQVQFESKRSNIVETQPMSDAITILRDTVLMPRRWRKWPEATDNYRARNELVWKVNTGPLRHRLLLGQGWIQVYDLNQQYLSSRNNGGLTGASLTGDGRLADSKAGPLLNLYPDLTYAEFVDDPQLAGYNTNLLMPINLFEPGATLPVPDLANRPPVYLNTYSKTYTSNLDFYANDVFSLVHDRLYLMAGLRHSHYARKTISFTSGAFPNKVLLASAPTSYATADATTSSFGAVWHLNAAHTYSLYANLNTSFSPEYRVNPDDAPPLQPEQGKQKEVGLRFSFLKGRVTGLVDYFDLLQNHVTQADPDKPSGSGYYIQLNGQRSTGFELSLNTRITDRWLAFGGYAYTDARNDITGVPKDLQPRHRFTLFNRYNFTTGRLKGLSFNLGTIYTGERPLTVSSTRKEIAWGPAPAWWRIDTGVNYRFRPQHSRFIYNLALNVNNVLDNTQIYYVAVTYRYTIDPGREWRAALSVQF